MTVRIALDAMGGDGGVSAVVGGIGSIKAKDVFYSIYGDASAIEAVRIEHPKNAYRIVTVDKVICNNAKPSHALRYGRGTSMFEAISSVSTGEADAVVTAGNTGAYMALSRALLKMVDGIDRPALVSSVPNVARGSNIFLDLGANAECFPENLLQFAIMGNAVAKVLLGLSEPRLGLLNVGTEKTKGTECVKEAYALLYERFNDKFVGFVEGTEILKTSADVIVADGFSGNISLKTMEGTFKFVTELYKNEVKSSLFGKLSYLMNRPILNRISSVIDPKKHNGAVLVGLNGIAVKSHGNADFVSFASAINIAIQLVRSNFVHSIKSLMESQA
jgi:glycerol-3-phosphate acyltransferase PlsX